MIVKNYTFTHEQCRRTIIFVTFFLLLLLKQTKRSTALFSCRLVLLHTPWGVGKLTQIRKNVKQTKLEPAKRT